MDGKRKGILGKEQKKNQHQHRDQNGGEDGCHNISGNQQNDKKSGAVRKNTQEKKLSADIKTSVPLEEATV